MRGTLIAEAVELSMSLVTPALALAKLLYFQGQLSLPIPSSVIIILDPVPFTVKTYHGEIEPRLFLISLM